MNPTTQTKVTPVTGALTPEFLSTLRDGYKMTPVDRACHNAVTNNPASALALNRAVVRGDDGHFSHRIKSKGITDQKKSGRCWMFAGLNVLRPQIIREHRMENSLFDYETLFGIDLTLSKANRTRFHAGASCHAMVLMGVDLDADGRTRKWLVENSHGKSRGDNGWWTLLDQWFDEHVYTIVVNKRHVPNDIMALFDEKPTVLPAWYPGAGGIRS